MDLRLGIVTHPKKKMAISVAADLYRYITKLSDEGEDVSVVFEEKLKGKIEAPEGSFRPVDDLGSDLVFAIGGDGTLLRTFQMLDLPVLGINVGSLGFLMEVSPQNSREAVDRILAGHYTIKERAKIHTRIGDEDLPDATNEVVLLSKTPAKMVSYEMYINMNWVEKVRGDGMIVSTPIGSTCYAMSAGGAILDPELPAFEIVALAPFITNIRPMIIPDTSVINIKIVERRRAAVLAIDGSHLRSVKHNEEILLTKSKRTAKFVRFDLDFYSQFREILAVSRPLERIKRIYR
jgi:NAD+ kinase